MTTYQKDNTRGEKERIFKWLKLTMATNGDAYIQVPKMTHSTPTMRDLFSYVWAPKITPTTTAAMNTSSTVTYFNTLHCTHQGRKTTPFQITLSRTLTKTQKKDRLSDYYPSRRSRIEEEDDQIDHFQAEANAVNGDDEKAVWVHKRHAVEDPQHTVEECGNVGYRGVVFHGFLLPYLVECRPVAPKNETLFRV